MSDADMEGQVDELIRGPQYALPQAEKDAALDGDSAGAFAATWPRNAPPTRRFLGTRPAGRAWQTPGRHPAAAGGDVQAVPALGDPPERIVRELHSSATTGQRPSRIVVDKTTAFRQARAGSVLKEHVGGRRRPLLALDAAESASAGEQPCRPGPLSAASATSPRKPFSA